MRRRGNRAGYTLFEMMLTAAIFAIIIGAIFRFLPQTYLYFQSIRLHQQIHTDARTAMDRMMQMLRSGIAGSVQICSCNDARCTGGSPDPCTVDAAVPPNSQINFLTRDGHWHRFYWENDAQNNNALIAEDYKDSSGTQRISKTVIATNVGSVMFSGDYRDFSIVNVDLRLDALMFWDGTKKVMATMILPTQSVRMISAQ